MTLVAELDTEPLVETPLFSKQDNYLMEVILNGEPHGYSFRADSDVSAKVHADSRYYKAVEAFLGDGAIEYLRLTNVDRERDRRREALSRRVPYHPMDLKGRIRGELPEGGC